MLDDVDPEAFTNELPFSHLNEDPLKAETEKLKNLQYVHEALREYIRDRCKRKLPLPGGEPNLEAVAQATSEQDVIQLLKLVFLAVIFGRFSMDYIQQLTSFPEEYQTQFYLILEETESLEESTSSPPSNQWITDVDASEDATSSTKDHQEDDGLLYEKHLAELVAANKSLQTETMELKEQLESLHDEHTRLQMSYDKLESSHKDTTDRLDALRSGKAEQSMVNIQRTKMQQQETVIADFESKISSLQKDRNQFEVQNKALNSQLAEFQKVQDELFELKQERKDLERKANTVDKYRQKVKNLQKVEEENEALKHRTQEMQRELKVLDSDQLKHSDLQRANDEVRQLVSGIERELNDAVEAKKRAEVENFSLQAKLQLADRQTSKLQEKFESIQERSMEQSEAESPKTPRGPVNHSASLAVSESDHALSDEAISRSVSKPDIESQNHITEEELQLILTAMRTHTKGISRVEDSPLLQQQKQAARIEHVAGDVKAIKKVIYSLQEPRIEFVGARNLDAEASDDGTVLRANDTISIQNIASPSYRSPVIAPSNWSRRTSAASFHSSHSVSSPKSKNRGQRASIFKTVLGLGRS